MAYKFPSQEWVVQFVEEINRSEAYADAAKTWEGDVLIVVEGQGGAYLDLWHGKCRNMEFLDDPTQKDAEFTLTATHDAWRKVLSGKLDPLQAMMTGQVKLSGNLGKVMTNIKAAQELVRCATRVDTEY